MRARAKFKRWEEESILIPSEMHWTILFFQNKAARWRQLATVTDSPGHICYAHKQIHMWTDLANRSQALVSKCLHKHQVPGDDIDIN